MDFSCWRKLSLGKPREFCLDKNSSQNFPVPTSTQSVLRLQVPEGQAWKQGYHGDTVPLFRSNPLYGSNVSNWGQRMKKGGAVIRWYQSSGQVQDLLQSQTFLCVSLKVLRISLKCVSAEGKCSKTKQSGEGWEWGRISLNVKPCEKIPCVSASETVQWTLGWKEIRV